MVLKKDRTTETIEQIKLPKWLDDLITKKWFLYVATAVVLVLLVGISLPASTKDNLANAIFAKTATDVPAIKPPSGGGGNPPVIGAATPTPIPEQETESYEPIYVYNPNIKWDWHSDSTAVAPAEPNDPKKKIVNERIWLKQCGFGDMAGRECYKYKYIDIGPQATTPLTSAEIAISNWPKKEDWKFTCVQRNAEGRCVSYNSRYIGKECYGWNTKGNICLVYKDGTKSNILEPRTN